MKTRNLPNLTQCHSCGLRIDSCVGENLEILYSEWRVVLLCKSCFLAVESSNLCSYCFKEGSSDNCFRCRQCKRIVHKTCFSGNAGVPPWSFSSSSFSQFSICLDCWIPKSIATKSTHFTCKKKDFTKCRRNLLEDLVREANFDAEKKLEAAVRARELVVEKALAARKAVQLSQKALNLCPVSSNCLSVPNSLVISSYGPYKNLDSLRSHAKDSDVNVQLMEGEGSSSNRLVCREGNLSIKPANDSFNGNRWTCLLKYSRRVSADRFRMKYKRKKLAHETLNAKTNRFMITYVKRSSCYERYKGKRDRFSMKYTRRKLNQKRDRFSMKYTRRKLNQRPVLHSKSI